MDQLLSTRRDRFVTMPPSPSLLPSLLSPLGVVAWTLLTVLLFVRPEGIAASSSSSSSTVTIQPNLNFGDINVVILTDIHSWLGGHSRQEPYYNADLGDVLSFYERLKAHCDENDLDLWLVNNGDFVHGTGLHRIVSNTGEDPSHLIPLLERMPYDAVNCGNHELYSASNVEFMTRPGGYVDWWGDRYITSNIMRRESNNKEAVRPLSVGQGRGQGRYRLLEGKHSRLLVFGFLYNMGEDATDLVQVQEVEEVVQQQWFHDALREERYDAILVLAHMDLVDPLVENIRSAIRGLIGQGTPVVFVTGHTHYRGVQQLEDLTMTFEAGMYLNTVGFVSFPGKESVRSDNASGLFHHQFMDANQKVLLEDTLGLWSTEAAATENGKQLSEFIHLTREQLGLDEPVGCAPHSFFMDRYLDESDSLWGLYRDQVIPKIFMGKHRQADLDGDDDNEMAMLISSESWRYDLYSNSTLVLDDMVAVAPFNDTVVYLGKFPSFSIMKANATLNTGSHGKVPNFVLIGDILYEEQNQRQHKLYHLYTHEFDASRLQNILKEISGKPVNVHKTSFQSTMIWLAFVKEYWACDGVMGQLPDWFPTPNHIIQQSQGGTGHNRIVAFVMSFSLIGLILLCTCGGLIVFRHVYSRMYQPLIVVQDEIVAFDCNNDENDEDDDDLDKSSVLQARASNGAKTYADAEDTELGDADHDAANDDDIELPTWA